MSEVKKAETVLNNSFLMLETVTALSGARLNLSDLKQLLSSTSFLFGGLSLTGAVVIGAAKDGAGGVVTATMSWGAGFVVGEAVSTSLASRAIVGYGFGAVAGTLTGTLAGIIAAYAVGKGIDALLDVFDEWRVAKEAGPRTNMSSARLSDVWGAQPRGYETNALDVLSDLENQRKIAPAAAVRESRYVPAGQSSARLPGAIGLVPLGHETNVLDVISELNLSRQFSGERETETSPALSAPAPLSGIYNTPMQPKPASTNGFGDIDSRHSYENNQGGGGEYGASGFSDNGSGWSSSPQNSPNEGRDSSGSDQSSGGDDRGHDGKRDNQDTEHYGPAWDGRGHEGKRDNQDTEHYGPEWKDGSLGWNGGYDWGGWNDGDWASGLDDIGGIAWGPVLLDVNGNGINVELLTDSSTFLRLNEQGLVYRSAWAGVGTGVLVIDADGDGQISRPSEFVFTDWDPTASGDLQAIKNIFDTNSNGALDTGDERWSQFRVSVNGELETLESLGIVSIDLTPTGSGQSFSDGSALSGMATFTRADGSTGAVGDAVLVSDVNGYLVKTTSEDRTDGSTVAEIRASNQDGSLAFINVIVTSADGHSVLTSFDDDGNGTFDRSQTKITNQSIDGIQTKTVGNFDASGALLDQTTVTTSADRNTVTTQIDHDGDGLADEEQVFAQNVDGSTATTILTFSKNGDVVSSLSTVTGPGGLLKTTSFDLDGDSLADRIVEELTVVAGTGARTKTVAERGRDGTIVTVIETATSADNRTQTTSADVDGDGTFDVIAVATKNVTAGNVTIQTNTHNQDGSLHGNAMSYVSSSGLIKNTSADVTGDGVADVLTSDTTTVASNGDRTQTTQQTSADGSLLSRTVTVANAAGTNRAISIDADGDGAYDSLRTIVSNASGATDTQSSYSHDGAVLIARTITTTSADGFTKSETLDVDGDGVVDAVSHSQTIKNTNGDAVTTVTRYNGAGTLQLGRTVTTVSADGLDSLVESYIDLNQTVDASTRTIKSLETDGSMVETATSLAGSTQVSVVRTVTSADRKSITQKSYVGSFDSPWKIASSTVADDGTATTVVETFSPDGSVVISRSTALVSRDGLETTTTTDLNGDGKADTRNVDVTALTADGGRIQKLTSYAGPYIGPANRIAETTITVAGNGLGSATATDFDGDGTIDRRSSDATVLNTNGSTTRTVSDFNGGGEVLVSREVTTSSATGLHVIKEVDADGDGTVDLRTVEVVDILADGGRTTTVSATNAANALRQKTVETISGDGLHRSSRVDLNGDGGYDRETTDSIVANGDQVTSQLTFSPDGTVLVSKVVSTKSANGLSLSTQSDLNGDQIFDTLERTVRKINADGSTTTTASKFNGDGTVRTAKTSTTVSADGLVETVQIFINADELADVTTVTKKTINGDGSVTQTVDQYAGSNNTKFGRTVSSISPDGRNTSGTLAWHADLLQVQQVSGSINPDGSSTTTETTTHSYNPFASKEIKTKTVAADGLSSSTKLEVYGYEGALTYSETVTSVKTLNGDGSVVEVGVGTRAVQNRTLRANRLRTYAARRNSAGRRSDRNPLGI